MTTLICTKCQSAVDVTGRSVTLSFICDSCQRFDEVSVEATTKIIDDITAQLEAERQTVMAGESRIVELGTQITDLCDQNIELLATIDKLKSDVGILHRQCFEILARVCATTLS